MALVVLEAAALMAVVVVEAATPMDVVVEAELAVVGRGILS